MAYIGTSPSQGVRHRYLFTATSGQTTFSGADDDSRTLSYTDTKFMDVFLNGVLLDPNSDYTATTGTSVVLTSGASAGDLLEVIAFDSFSVFSGTFGGDVTVGGALGVGTSSPTEKMSVNGAIVATGGPLLSTGVSGTYVSFDTASLVSNIYALSPGVAWRDLSIGARDTIFSGSGTEHMRILSTGGITFNGDTSTANALDDYEEGTFTPSNSYVTITVNGSGYVKVGNIVIYRFDVTFPTNSDTNLATLTGFPFSSPAYNGGFTHWTDYGAPPPIHISGTTAYVQNPASASSTLQLQNVSGKRIICNAVVSLT